MTTFGPYPGTVTSAHDGDTVRVLITIKGGRKPKDIGWDVTLKGGVVSIVVDARTFGDNAAELATPAGQAALAHLTSLMPLGTSVLLVSHGWDKYAGRSDCSITLPDGSDLVTRMIADGFAVAWNGVGPKPVPAP